MEIDWADLEPFLGHFELKANVAAAFDNEDLLGGRDETNVWLRLPDHPWRWWAKEMFSPVGSVILTIAEAWEVPVETVLAGLDFVDDDGEFVETEIGSANGVPFIYKAGIVTRPPH